MLLKYEINTSTNTKNTMLEHTISQLKYRSNPPNDPYMQKGYKGYIVGFLFQPINLPFLITMQCKQIKTNEPKANAENNADVDADAETEPGYFQNQPTKQ